MEAVINHLHLTIPVDQLRPDVEQVAAPLLAGMPGLKAFDFVKVADGRATVILLWDSAVDAQAGAQAFGPTWFAKNIAPHLASEQPRSLGEVIVHAAD